MSHIFPSLMLSAALLCSACVPSSPNGAVQAAATPDSPPSIAFGNTDAERNVIMQNPVSDDFRADIVTFSAKTSSALLSGEENLCYSPLSLYFALSLSASGSRGNTQKQLLSLLGQEDAAALTEQCGNLYRQLYTDNEFGQLKISNSLWMSSQGSFKKEFLRTATGNFYASLYTGDLNSSETMRAMTEWVKNNTGGRISPEFQPDPNILLYLLNTIHLQDEWSDPFESEDNTVAPFYCTEDTIQQATFMHQMDISNFIRGADFTSASLSLKNFNATFVLPNEGVPLHTLLTENKLSDLFHSGGAGAQHCYGHIYWAIPKFKYTSRLDLTDMLHAAGVTDLFDPAHADLSGMAEHAPLFLSTAQQETYVSIHEQGVDAAACTLLGVGGSAAPEDEVHMTLNRPFLYFITAPGGTPLFVGVCAQPSPI